ncbi:hypothetical protein CYMTET_37537 [Cymbomonas tetramitiformis]|uniref:Uncharacterized protein n=1 Tax=Cymbomonas tetramitiformis TaxID=36881 RepID=A0AAE0CFC1_9CHLO|nr:hypothetical protein CYMTET_37537 [Cymbomonas tetramitiformis]
MQEDELLSNEESAQMRKQKEDMTEKKSAGQQARLEKEIRADGKQQPVKRIRDDKGEGGAPKAARLEAASTAAEGGKRLALAGSTQKVDAVNQCRYARGRCCKRWG